MIARMISPIKFDFTLAVARPALLDMSGNCIIIQARAEPQKIGSAQSN